MVGIRNGKGCSMLKEDILRELESHRNIPVSGQTLADKYCVSRNAVWKAVNALKKDGYEIVSSSNKGYYIPDSCDIISEQGIRKDLKEPYKQLDIRTFSVIDSTNNEAKRILATEDCDRVLIVADAQEKGRGRLGRSFYSPESSGIYMTLIYRTREGVPSPMLITMAAAVAVVRAIESLTNIKPGLKWVNDIFVGDKKAGGILTEAMTDLETGRVETVAVGIGLNIRKQEFPDHLEDVAVSLDITEVNRNRIIAEITGNLLSLYDTMNPDCFMDEYIRHSIVIGKTVRYEKNGEILTAAVKGISKDGSLVIADDNGQEDYLNSGEILLK